MFNKWREIVENVLGESEKNDEMSIFSDVVHIQMRKDWGNERENVQTERRFVISFFLLCADVPLFP